MPKVYNYQKKIQGPSNRNKKSYDVKIRKKGIRGKKENRRKSISFINLYDDIDEEEINLLKTSIDKNEFIFQYNIDNNQNGIEYKEKVNFDLIYKSEVENISLDEINIYKNLLKQSKIIKTKNLNFYFINYKEINDIKRISDLKIKEEELSDIDSNTSEENEKENNKIDSKDNESKDSIKMEKTEELDKYEKIDYKFIYFEKK